MKKIFIGAAVAIAALAACQKTEVTAPSADAPVLYATIEETDVTRTYMDENNNIRWSEGDQVAAFVMVPYGSRYQVNPSFVGKTYAEFSMVPSDDVNDNYAGAEWDHIAAYYPYTESVSCVFSKGNYVFDIILPSELTYAQDSFGNGDFPMVAVSETKDLTFRNVLGGMKLQLKGTQTVTSITLEGKNNEKLSGAATVTAYTDETKPVITMSDGASTSVTLDCGSGVQLNESTATEFIIALPPVLFGSGFTVTVTDSESHIYTVETDKNTTVLRSTILLIPPVTLAAPEGEDSEIILKDYIDEYGENHGQGVEINGVVWAPVNCGYH